ncbi:AAA family ATPase [Polynucleobacter sp. UB-Tiil-W10]|uniref:AAA family ATPase n=1 Tax=Polynucleobacter sp. UB-Tiil-W10 TaxID=1855648 RepID=UPI001C0C48BA|nr:AAA family ATPase [Polynucleobacter sp. UB-Tiil-W10]MBU3540228.1 AAA family ATPase [Polynucleobacter sp. UB-Tiil-W10]
MNYENNILSHLIFDASKPENNIYQVLSQIDPGCSRSEWMQVGFGCIDHLGELAQEPFSDWSQGCLHEKYDFGNSPPSNYSLKDLESQWADWIKRHAAGKTGITFGTVKHIAKRNSGQQPEPTKLTVISRTSGGISAKELANKKFPPLIWVVQDILPEGCYLLSARPKVGKSWLALQCCIAVAYGSQTLGKEVQAGKAIYLALEDNQRRLQGRLKIMRPQGYSTDNLILHTEWPKLNDGGLEALEKLIISESPRLVVIDTLAKVRPSMGRNSNLYESDYSAVAPLTGLANKYRCCILVVTHNRKGKSDSDALEQISGSLGLSGAVDGALVIDGIRSDKQYKLSLIGRDIPNDDELAISRQENGEWKILGEATQVFISAERKEITDVLRLHPAGLKPKEIAEIIGKKQPTVRRLLSSMAVDRQVQSSAGTYTLISSNSSNNENIDNSSNTGNSSHLSGLLASIDWDS